MTAKRRLLFAVAALLLCSGCTTWRVPVRPPRGALFTHYRAPLTGNVSDVPVSGKGGAAHTSYFHDWLFTGVDVAWDDASIQKAAQDAGLSKVYYADYEVLAVLGVYAEFTVRIYGE